MASLKVSGIPHQHPSCIIQINTSHARNWEYNDAPNKHLLFNRNYSLCRRHILIKLLSYKYLIIVYEKKDMGEKEQHIS